MLNISKPKHKRIMKVDVRMVVEVPDGYDMRDVKDYLGYEFGYDIMFSSNKLYKNNASIFVKDMKVEKI